MKSYSISISIACWIRSKSIILLRYRIPFDSSHAYPRALVDHCNSLATRQCDKFSLRNGKPVVQRTRGKGKYKSFTSRTMLRSVSLCLVFSAYFYHISYIIHCSINAFPSHQNSECKGPKSHSQSTVGINCVLGHCNYLVTIFSVMPGCHRKQRFGRLPPISAIRNGSTSVRHQVPEPWFNFICGDV